MRDIIASAQQPPVPPGCLTDGEELRRILSEIIGRANNATQAIDSREPPTLAESRTELWHTFRVGMPIGTARVKVDTYRKQCHGQLLSEDEQSYAFRVVTLTTSWPRILRRWLARPSDIMIHVQFHRVHAQSATPISVTVKVTLVGSGKKQNGNLLKGKGKELLEGLRAYLCSASEKRPNERLLWPRPVEISPVEEDGSVGTPIQCRGKDISLTGMAFYLPHELPTSQVVIRLQESENSRALTIPATLVRAHRCADGWYDVGVLFRVDPAVCPAAPSAVCAQDAK